MTEPSADRRTLRRRYFHPHFKATAVELLPGEHYVTRDPGEMLVTTLGSCVAACVRDRRLGVGGMNHFMLPDSPDGLWGGRAAAMRYGNFAMDGLIELILSHGGLAGNLEIKLFGGAQASAAGQVGDRNSSFVEAYLERRGITPEVSHLRPPYPLRIHYFPVTGKVFAQDLGPGWELQPATERRP